MTAVTAPLLLTAKEFAANPLGIDITKLLKDGTTLQAGVTAAATTLPLNDKQGWAPARNDPKAAAIASYGIDNGDLVFVGAGTAADPLEWVVATGPMVGASAPFNLPVTATQFAHSINSPVSIGALQQELLSAAGAVEQYCQQPIGVVQHPVANWPPNEYLLGQIWASVDARGSLTLFVPFIPIVSTFTPVVQFKRIAGSASGWTTADITQWEVLTDRIISPQGMFMRREFVLLKVTYQSGFAVVPDDVKEATRFVAVAFLKSRGGQAVVAGSGRLMTSREPKDIEIPGMAKSLLNTYRAVR
jgi:hypothetical protein